MQTSDEFNLSFNSEDEELAYIQAELRILISKLEFYGIDHSTVVVTCFVNLVANAFEEKGEEGIKVFRTYLDRFLSCHTGTFIPDEPSLN